MRPSHYALSRPRAGLARVCVLASALLTLGGSLAAASQPAQTVQYRPGEYDQYGRPPPGPPGPRGYDDPDQYGRYRPDPNGPGRRGYDERYSQQGGGRGGSYQRSCEDIRQDGPMLSAVCGDGRGRRVESSIDTRRCGRSDIGNNRGYLQCGGTRASGRPVD